MRFFHSITLLPSLSRLIGLLAFVAMLGGCGGGSGGEGTFLPQEDNGDDGVIIDVEDPSSTIVIIGGQIDGTFVEGQIALGLSEISATGLTSVSVELRDADGSPVLTSFDITFTSTCVQAGTSTIVPAVVTTTNGEAQADYAADGCEGNDEITATAVIAEETLIATANLLVEPGDVGSVEFVSATPNQIALAGSGGTENSIVTFVVRGETGSPLQDATVNFELNSTTGGLTLFPDNDVSGADGIVTTTVSAGNIATSIRVTATEESSGISTQSSELVVSTGIPDEDSFSISADKFNPEGGNVDGIPVDVTVRAADAFNNPAPENTAISFYAEGGSIDPTCSTDLNGACSVTWRSQQPKPADGRVTILATAIGNESFDDSNGNGLFDDIDVEFDSVTDLGEAYADENESGAYEIGEFFIDFGVPNGLRDGPDGAYNGVLCANPSATRWSSCLPVS